MGCGVEVQAAATDEGPGQRSTWRTCAGTRSSSAPTPTSRATRSARRSADDALPALPPTLIQEGYVYIAGARRCTRSTLQGQDVVRLHRARRRPRSCAGARGRGSYSIQPLEGPGRERPRDDVADDDEPREPPPHQGHCPRPMPSAPPQVFDLLLGDNLQGRKEHIAEHGYGVPGRAGRVVRLQAAIPLRRGRPRQGRIRAMRPLRRGLPSEGAGTRWNPPLVTGRCRAV